MIKMFETGTFKTSVAWLQGLAMFTGDDGSMCCRSSRWQGHLEAVKEHWLNF